MKIIKQYLMENTFVSQNTPDTNYSRFAYFTLSSELEEEALMKLDLNELQDKDFIKKVELNLYVKEVEDTSTLVGIFANSTDFDEEKVSWSNKPNYGECISTFEVNKCNEERYITVDITNIALKYVNDKYVNNGFTLKVLDGEGAVKIVSSRGFHAPYLKIEEDIDESINFEDKNAYGVVTINEAKRIEVGQTISFSNTEVCRGISCLDTGEFEIAYKGKYILNWWMNCCNKSKDSCQRISIDLLKCDGVEVLSKVLTTNTCTSEKDTSIVTGTVIIDIENDNEKYKFINSAKENFNLCVKENYSASVVITRIN